jgi:hypothetical protein
MKPVAWITESCKCYSTPLKAIEDGNKEELIPVYTAPQGDGEVCGGCGAIRYDPICQPAPRELSDEEIQEVLNMPEFQDIFELEDFARAILKKASEK